MFGKIGEHPKVELNKKENALLAMIADNDMDALKETELNSSEKKFLLFASAKEGNTDAIEFLLGDPADENLLNDTFVFRKSRYQAWEYPNKQIRAIVGEKFADRYTNFNVLMAAIKFGQTEAAQLLIEKGVDLNHKTKGWRGPKAIHFAARYGHTDIVRAIIEKDPNMINEYQDVEITALMEAADQGYLDTVRLLVDNNARLDGALRSAKNGGHEDVLIYFINETDVLNDNIDGQFSTAIYAINTGMFNLFSTLLKQYDDLTNHTDENGKTLLHYAARKREYDINHDEKIVERYKMEKLLLEKNPDLATEKDNKKHMPAFGSERGKQRDLLRLYNLRDKYQQKDYGRIRFLGVTLRYSSEEKYKAAKHLIQYELRNHENRDKITENDLNVLKHSPIFKSIYKHLAKEDLEATNASVDSTSSM